ncbi:hypothetical protein ON010_g3143 [Phytophthora cinnamomi]|nr:hypothetical protein ON010_g3143 [Phytophthora cinnamomi]
MTRISLQVIKADSKLLLTWPPSAEIVRKFAGRESQLCAKLFKKYGEAPDLSPGGGQGAESRTKASTLQAAVKYQWNFKPYELAAATDSPLDFRSAQFDAFKALQAPKKLLKLPVTTAYPLDNIQKCRHLTLVARPKKTSPAAAEAKAAVAKKTSAAAAAPSLFEQLAGRDTGWLSSYVLGRAFSSASSLLSREDARVCGSASDQQYVTQEFVPHSTHERLLREVREGTRAASDAVFSVADHRRNQRVLASAGGTQREYIKQVFIRGDNVVSVSAVAGNNAERRGYGTARPNKPRP